MVVFVVYNDICGFGQRGLNFGAISSPIVGGFLDLIPFELPWPYLQARTIIPPAEEYEI